MFFYYFYFQYIFDVIKRRKYIILWNTQDLQYFLELFYDKDRN